MRDFVTDDGSTRIEIYTTDGQRRTYWLNKEMEKEFKEGGTLRIKTAHPAFDEVSCIGVGAYFELSGL